MANWNLPEPIVRAVRLHHSPDGDRAQTFSLSRLVQAADRVVNRLGYTASPSQPADTGPPEEPLEQFDLAGRGAQLLEDFNAELEIVKGLF